MKNTINNDEENYEYEFGTGSVFKILDDMAALREEREKAEQYNDVYIQETYSSPEKHSKVCKEAISDKSQKLKSKYKSSEEYKKEKGIDFSKKKQEFKDKYDLKDDKKKYCQKTFVPQKKQVYKQSYKIYEIKNTDKNKAKKKQGKIAALFKLFGVIYVICIFMGLLQAFFKISLNCIFDLIGQFFSGMYG